MLTTYGIYMLYHVKWQNHLIDYDTLLLSICTNSSNYTRRRCLHQYADVLIHKPL